MISPVPGDVVPSCCRSITSLESSFYRGIKAIKTLLIEDLESRESGLPNLVNFRNRTNVPEDHVNILRRQGLLLNNGCHDDLQDDKEGVSECPNDGSRGVKKNCQNNKLTRMTFSRSFTKSVSVVKISYRDCWKSLSESEIVASSSERRRWRVSCCYCCCWQGNAKLEKIQNLLFSLDPGCHPTRMSALCTCWNSQKWASTQILPSNLFIYFFQGKFGYQRMLGRRKKQRK